MAKQKKPGFNAMDQWPGDSDLAPVPLIGEYEENGVKVKRYAPGWAIGVKPSISAWRSDRAPGGYHG